VDKLQARILEAEARGDRALLEKLQAEYRSRPTVRAGPVAGMIYGGGGRIAAPPRSDRGDVATTTSPPPSKGLSKSRLRTGRWAHLAKPPPPVPTSSHYIRARFMCSATAAAAIRDSRRVGPMFGSQDKRTILIDYAHEAGPDAGPVEASTSTAPKRSG
jgi:hypothetical protein